MGLRPAFWLSLLAVSTAILIVPSAAQAQQEIGPQPVVRTLPALPANVAATDAAAGTGFDVSASSAIASDYIYRGYTLSNHRPSVSGEIDASYNIFFASVGADSVDVPQLSHIEMTDSAGVRPKFGSLTFEAGTEYYSYPGSEIHTEYLEFYAAPSYDVSTKLTVEFNARYAPNYDNSGAWESYNSAMLSYKLDPSWSISGELGRQDFGTTRPIDTMPAIKLPDYTYWNFGISYVYKSLTADLRYYGDTLSKQSCFLITGTGNATLGSNGCSATVVGTLTFSLTGSGSK